VSAEVDGLLGQLGSADPKQRGLAAAYLGDLLERAALAQPETERVAAALVAAALREPDNDAREELLHALASTMQGLPLALVWPLCELLPRLDLQQLDYCLYILAATHDAAAEAVIVPFMDHPDPAIRECAREALTELRGRD
jgi:hypothetical protein